MAGDRPEDIDAFVTLMASEIDSFKVDAPSDPSGEWWIDLELDGLAVEELIYQPGNGFGVYTDDTSPCFGAKPDSWIWSPRHAAEVMTQKMRDIVARETQ